MPLPPTIQILRLRPLVNADISLPRYMTDHASGMDICAAVQTEVSITPGEIVLIPTGFAMALPGGYEGQVRPRSGLAIRHGITVVNAPGTIDADYRGEIKVGLINLSKKSFVIKRGDRIAQMVIQRIQRAKLVLVDALDSTAREDGGFGHTGI